MVLYERPVGLEGIVERAAAGAEARPSVGHGAALSGHFGSFIGFSAGFAMLSKTQFPDVQILHFAFFGPFIGALARSMGGAISDRLGGTRVTLVNFVVMAIFSGLLFLTLPTMVSAATSLPSSACLWCCS